MTTAADLAAAGRLVGRPVSFVARLRGGQHAVTTVVSDGDIDYVVRRFPPGDEAVAREIQVLPRLTDLGPLVPRLIGYDDDPAGPVIVTDRVAGTAPRPTLDLGALAAGMGDVLARIHTVDGTGLPRLPTVAVPAPTVLSHNDFWCGNLLWRDATPTGVVDWSSACDAPRGSDVAWGRLDLVLLGSYRAADELLVSYERAGGESVVDVAAWDRYAAGRAEPNVDTWHVNYAGIGRPVLTGRELRRRFDAWVTHLR